MLNSNKISAVVRTWNSDKTLAITLQSLKIQSPMIDEIIVVDSGSSDTTLQIAEKFGCCIIHYPKEPFNYSKALNLGIRKAAGPRVLIISSHTVLAYKNIVELMSLQLDRFFAAGVYCTVLSKPFDLPRQADPVRGQLIDMIHEDNFNGNNGLGNPCSLIERACWEIHHFDETLPAAEDIEWALWHYRNTKRATIRIRNAGVLYMNPHNSKWKSVREHAIIANFIYPSFKSWKGILKTSHEGILACLTGRLGYGLTLLWMALEVARSKIFNIKYNSAYYK